MKICFITPGEISVPPTGWGALETVVWNQYLNLKKSGYDVSIINEKNSQDILNILQQTNPDIVHLHYGSHYEIMPHIKCRKIITNHDGSFLLSKQFHESIIRKYLYDCEFFILTTWERDFLLNIGISPQKVKILPNGVDFNAFDFKAQPEFPDASICLGKIDKRKNQAFIQSLNAWVYFVGENTISEFNSLDEKYLGSWTREEVYENLTNYTNLVLISSLELQPLVCLEALSAGLGLVISEAAAQNLDASLPFITIIPQDLIYNAEIVSAAISNNRDGCIHVGRKAIREYAKTFDWNNLTQKYISNLL
jgi:glycosyltransferase involved in cell wall biosynthesis